ncbi:MAG TPA: hypothetical protein DCS07_03115 [Bdellovibrionales bacterium]|nr:hypothetical protein [Bdellovibrionales bacterium]
MRSIKSLVVLFLTGLITSCGGSDQPASTPTPQAQNTNVPTTSAVSAVRAFDFSGGRAVPMDFGTETLELNLDATTQESTGRAVIQFQTPEAGKPYFLFNGNIRSVTLNGQSVSIQEATTAGGDSVNVLDITVQPGASQTVTIDYSMSGEAVSYRAGGVGFITAMADIDDGNFFEAYGPASFEDDQLKMTMTVNIKGAARAHQLYTNGTLTQLNTASWSVDFPAYFTTSSFYVHLTDLALAVRQTVYPGLEREIPITVYASDESSASSAIAAVPALFAELERDYGPYLHNSFIAYISGSGGMEHNGATITSLSAIGHELTHSWFGRGVMPQNGSSGWIDEAIATWRDRGYPSNLTEASLDPANIGNLSPFERFTPFLAYNQGGELMTVLDNLFTGTFGIQGGLKAVLKDFFAQWKTRLTTTDAFETFLEQRTGANLTQIFSTYVTGGQAGGTVGTTPPAEPGQPGVVPVGTLHPPALTPGEVRQIR